MLITSNFEDQLSIAIISSFIDDACIHRPSNEPGFLEDNLTPCIVVIVPRTVSYHIPHFRQYHNHNMTTSRYLIITIPDYESTNSVQASSLG